jgi:prepilin-type N-terminal cleavage/methylation domain-containing protein
MKKQIISNKQSVPGNRRGFTIIEVVVSLIVVALICSSVMLVMKHLMVALGESRMRMEAFEIARENMENLLTAASVEEMDDYGVSDKNPNIEWETVVEPFSGAGDKMWVRAICSATYPDANGQPKTVELTHWLTDVPDSVMQQIMKDQEKLRDMNDPNFPADTNGYPDAMQNQNRPSDNKPMDPELKKFLDQLPKE